MYTCDLLLFTSLYLFVHSCFTINKEQCHDHLDRYMHIATWIWNVIKLGIDGTSGRTGDPGITGLPGIIGQKGIKGFPGPRGENGDVGVPGDPGYCQCYQVIGYCCYHYILICTCTY